jgi:hypothetical protein
MQSHTCACVYMCIYVGAEKAHDHNSGYVWGGYRGAGKEKRMTECE